MGIIWKKTLLVNHCFTFSANNWCFTSLKRSALLTYLSLLPFRFLDNDLHLGDALGGGEYFLLFSDMLWLSEFGGVFSTFFFWSLSWTKRFHDCNISCIKGSHTQVPEGTMQSRAPGWAVSGCQLQRFVWWPIYTNWDLLWLTLPHWSTMAMDGNCTHCPVSHHGSQRQPLAEGWR